MDETTIEVAQTRKRLLTPARLGVAVTAFMTTLLVATAAFATAPSPGGPYTGVYSNDGPQAQADILDFLGKLVSTIVPVLIAIALGVIGLIILAWGIRLVYSKVRGAAHF